MLVLVVDSATPAITAAVARISAGHQVSVLAERVTEDARAHGELLAPSVAAVLSESGHRATDLGAVVAGVGPGPFTGLRVGLVTAAALADTLAIPAYGVCTLDAIGADAGPGRVLVATDARRREVYWAVYADGTPVTPPAVNRPADLDPAGLRATRAAGAGAHLYAQVLALPVADTPRFPRAASLARLAAERALTAAPAEPLTPLYLRRPDAVAPGARKPVS